MLVVQNRRFRKEFMVCGSGIFGSLLKFHVRTFTSQAAKMLLLLPHKRYEKQP